MMDIEFPEVVGTLADLPEKTIKVVKAYAKATAAMHVSGVIAELKVLRAYKEAAEKQAPEAYGVRDYDGKLRPYQFSTDLSVAEQWLDPSPTNKLNLVALYARPVSATRPAPCEHLCEAKAYEIEIRQLKAQLETAGKPIEVTKEMIFSFCNAISDASITEQDAREIGLASLRYWVKTPNATVDTFLEDEYTQAILAKLNADKADLSEGQRDALAFYDAVLHALEKAQPFVETARESDIAGAREAEILMANVYDTVRGRCPSHESEQS